jgi:hypothetical protein
MKDLYDTTKKLAGSLRQTSQQIKYKHGKVLTTTEEQLARWAEHFKELLNRPPPDVAPAINRADEELKINLNLPSKTEIKQAIKKLITAKASGPDNIPSEALKANPYLAPNILHKICNDIWKNEVMPQDWNIGHLIKLPKKGNLKECKNYRGIALLSVVVKVLNRILLTRLLKAVDEKLREQQAGFRKDRSCTDQIVALRIIIEQSLEWNNSLFLNFEKAFDSLDREVLWNLMAYHGIPQKFINIIRNSYSNMQCRVIHEGKLTESFDVKTGVKQGCLLSPFLFLLAIDYIMRESTEGKRNGIQWTMWQQLDDLDFADDIALISSTQQQMQEKTSLLAKTSIKLGLRPDESKTKVMNAKRKQPIKIKDTNVEEGDEFTYLGVNIEADVKNRINKARVIFNILGKV